MVESASTASVLESIQHIARKLSSRPVHAPGIEPLTPLEQLVLQTVQRTPGITASQVSSSLNILPSNTSTALKRLTALGLVERSRDPLDGRRVTLRLTDTALRNIARVHEGWLGRLDGLSATPEQLAAAACVLREIDGLLSEQASV